MKISHGIFSLAIVGCIWGCGSGSPSTDFDALHALYTSPTGTLGSPADVKSATSQFSTSERQGGGLPLGAQSLHPSTAGIRPQDVTVNVSCPGGGSLNETIASSSSTGGQASIDYSNCVYDSGSISDTINGTMSYAEYTSPAMELFSGSLTVTATPPGTTETVNLNFALVDGVMTFSVSVADGTVLVSEDGSWDPTTDTGMLTITDRTATWTCTLDHGKGSCVSPGHAKIVF